MFGQLMENRMKIRSHERMKTVVLKLAGLCVVVSLTACGGGGGSPGVVDTGPVDPPIMTFDESLALPSGHGLSAGEIRVAAGGSAEHGNVVVSCPAGGPACVVTVAADGTASYDRTGGVPSVEAREQAEREAREQAEREAREQAEREAREQAEREAREQAEREAREQAEREARGYSRDNPTAEDLLDHWNDPETLRSALGLSAVSQSDIAVRKRGLKALLDAVSGDSGNASVRFRNVRLEDVEIIGEKAGITYGQWKGGPAGTLNIEFDWRFAEHVGAKYRAELERVGKKWSYRILDDFGTHTIEQGSSIERRIVLNESLSTDGLLISMLDEGDETDAGKATFSPEGKHLQEMISSYNDYEPYWGVLNFISEHYQLSPRARTYVMAHELGHILGLFALSPAYSVWQNISFGSASAPGGWTTHPSYMRYVDLQNRAFTGPEAQKANDGDPVPLLWEDDGAGGWPSYGHTDLCYSVLGGCDGWGGTVFLPGEVDFAMLDDIGYEVLDAETAAKPELYGWGAWGTYSAWGIGVARELRFDHMANSQDRLFAAADAFGIAPTARLADNPVLTGAATWSGSLLGVDLGQDMLPPVFGDADLQVELSSLKGAARFDNLTVFVENDAAPFRAPSLEYTVEVTGNSFSDSDNRISGGFFGPAHEEMAGVLVDRTSSVNLLAGFGGKR